MLRLLCDYTDVTQLDNYVFDFLLRRLFKHFSHFGSIDVTPSIL